MPIRGKRRTVSLNDAEKKMIDRLTAEMGMSKGAVLRYAIRGLYYAHFGERTVKKTK